MLWEEQPDKATPYTVPDKIVDLAFRTQCRSLPLDHAYALSQALHKALPWLTEEDAAGVHLIHGAESGNGWIRPEDPLHDVLYLSKRTRFTLRLPKHRVEDAKQLVGQALDVDGNTLTLGPATVRLLSPLTTIFARYVAADDIDDDEAFLAHALTLLEGMGIRVKKIMSGRKHVMRTPDNEIPTRSLMLAELEVEHSIKLQQQGLGPWRKLGCGLFLPHKGIEAVNRTTGG